MDSITALVLVVAPVALLAGWVMRSPHMGYVGVQIGFGFFVTALPGFGATTNITFARDRLIGVGLGILVMWFIFDQLWPARTSDALARSLRRIRAATAELAGGDAGSVERRHFQHLRTAVSQELMNVQQLEQAARFDVGRHHKRELARSRRLIRQIETAASEFYRWGRAST
jgi:multidrug resistance protein MdtO